MSSAIERRYYDRFHDYDTYLADFGWHVPRTIVRHTRSHLSTAQVVLDVGCGTGQVGESVRALHWNGGLYGCDISFDRLLQARSKGIYNGLVHGNAYTLPWGDASFPMVVSSALLGLAGPRALREMFRVTAPKGTVVTTVATILSRRSSRTTARRIMRYVARQHLATLIDNVDLGTGYRRDRDDEHYRLLVFKRSPTPFQRRRRTTR